MATKEHNQMKEEEYKALAIDLIDQAVENKLYWLAESGFTNAKDCNPQQDLDGWNGGGYWEFVYTSIASNIDSHNIVFVPKETQAEKRVHDTIDKLDASGFFNEDKY
jgi:hypothetical protein